MWARSKLQRGQLGGDGVAELEAHVGQLGARAGGVVEHVGVAVDADDLAGRTDERRQLRQDADRAAADVDGAPTGGDVEAVEQPVRLVLHQRRLGDEASPFGLAVTEHVLGSCGRGGCAAPHAASQRRTASRKSWRTPEDRVEVSVGVADGRLLA